MDEPVPPWHGFPVNHFNPHAWIIGDPRIGTGTWIGAFCVIDGSGGLTIGEGVDVSAGAQIYTHSTVKRATREGDIERAHTVIGDHCHIGAGAIILMGCHIGAHSVVGAGAVVLEGTVAPPRSLIIGNPARVRPRGRGPSSSAVSGQPST